MAFKDDDLLLPWLCEHPEWLDEVRLVEIDAEPELIGSADAMAAFFNWAAERETLEFDTLEAASLLKSIRAEVDRRRGLPIGGDT